jgi:hypothetical protein
VAGGEGFEPPLRSSEKALSIAIWSFLRSNLPFFCGEGSAGRVKSLAGDEINESDSSQLPLLRKDFTQKNLDGNESSDTGDSQVSSMRQYESLERWKGESGFRSEAALPVQSLRALFFSSVKTFFFSLFSFLRRLGISGD